MEQRCCGLGLVLIFFFLLSFSAGSVQAYRNYTVGDSLGWYDNLLKPSVNFQTWAAPKNFSLGDFLIFNTDANHSVVQTYNFTTYKRCDYNNALESDTINWSSAPPSNSPQPVTVEVPLVKEGMNYFFSGDYDGEQCKYGQHFKINVKHGQGLPPSLQSPSQEAPAPANPDSGGDESAPDTIVPSNFNNPQDTSDNSPEISGSVSLSGFEIFSRRGWNGVLVLFGVNLFLLII